MEKEERHKLISAALYPLLFLMIIGLVHLIQYVFEVRLTHFGVYPRDPKGLIGILTMPLLHGDFSHLFNNSIPLLILGSSLFFFYKEVALRVSFWIYLMVGVWTWVYAREAYHIGASGLLYGLFSFLLVSGFIRRNKQLISLSFAVIFLYGSLVWGIFPIDVSISFEGHLWGFVAGVILAFYYRKQGPQKFVRVWEDEDDDDLDDDDPYWEKGYQPKPPVQRVTYVYKPKQKEEE